MPRRRKEKFYAVLNGRWGRQICTRWEDYRQATYSFSGASSKSFLSYEDAVKWLEQSGFPPPQLNEQGAQMLLTSLATAGPSTPRRRYPNSTTYWQDHRAARVDVGVQTSPVSSPARRPPTVTPISLRRTASHSRRTPQQPIVVNDPPPVQLPPVQLSEEQRQVLELVKSGRNVFFTGPAGTGKSVLLREIIRELKLIKQVAVTATTGIAGVNIGGSTVHSFAGIGLGKEKAETLAEKIKYSSHTSERWRSVQVLIIDEISMMDAMLFDKLEYIAREVRDCQEPFGGIQLALSGDFYQLPPVPEQSHEYRMPATYAFDAVSWSRCIARPIFLTQVFRQTDNTFVDILSSMRVGVLSSKHIELLRRLSRPLHYEDGIEPSELFPLRKEVESCNNCRLAALPGPSTVYKSTDRAGYDYRHQSISDESANKLLDRLVAVPKLTLKLGAQVMLIQNVVQKVLVNGSVGRVIEFLTTSEAVARNIAIAEIMPTKGRYPHHQLQPELPEVSPSDMRPLNNNLFSNKEKWPLVRFTNGNELLCAPLEFTVEGFMGNTEASRLQVPLILAWSLSIHKSQGQTLTRVKVDLGRIFEKGQAYVAISRATTMKHLEIRNFQPGKIMAHPRVIEWHRHWTAGSCKQENSHPEMDSDEAISRYWDDTDDWNDIDDWNDSEDVKPQVRPVSC
ncbi:putative DNA-dependent ATPase and 5'-3' DNA helicase required for the maintenance of both mitochondrial and nuclear genome stability [Lyophyllum shimeji]|uniref:ATP-dependent DNA helicase PIF1 n=1 Tax=Lyophyllum shimeji TaxID=47721 RepID=A0A9P3UKB6_LYOSH|nr:putative DNA-dependent ATPase and 5'-3' DNA helicase required for the maintenance of both mitochondrial and nuclear genome stability [Lyophyllum shimeji]